MEECKKEIRVNGSISPKNSDSDTSFVSKVRSRVSGLFNTSISTLFGSENNRYGIIRKRETDDHPSEEQPPCKKSKSPEDLQFDTANCRYGSSSTSHCESDPVFSNVSEPVAALSCFQKQKNLHKTLSSSLSHSESLKWDNYSDSGESTSGYSSGVKACNQNELSLLETHSLPDGITKIQRDGAVDDSAVESRSLFNKSSPQSPLRSLFGEKSLNSHLKNSSVSTRRPSFISPNFSDRTATASRIMNSPFYNGSTTYGGSSAYSKLQKKKEFKRDQFSIKPFNKSGEGNPYTSLSKTARRILSTLEQYSTQTEDTETITSLPTKLESQKELRSKYIGASPYRLKKNRVGSDKELLVPTVSELLKIKHKQRLQVTTDELKHIGTANSSTSFENYVISKNNQQKHSNKLRAKLTSVRTKAPVVEAPENILKFVQLTLPENKLPKIDLIIPPPTGLDNSRKEEVGLQAEKKSSSNNGKEDFLMEFTFSKPVVISDNLKSLIAINNFKFSEPSSKKYSGPDSKDTTASDSKDKTMKVDKSITNTPQQADIDENQNDSIMKRFKPTPGSWECTTCLIRNKAEVARCIACETLRAKDDSKVHSFVKSDASSNGKQDAWMKSKIQMESNSSDLKNSTNEFNKFKCTSCSAALVSSLSKCLKCGKTEEKLGGNLGFGSKFKPASGTWECQTCLVRNQPDVEKCIACETTRDTRNNVKQSNALNGRENSSWKCDTCWIMNKSELSACAACQTPKNSASASVPVKPVLKMSQKWECPTCMVRNDENVENCPCCATLKPGVTLINKNTISMFNFGINKTQFTFGSSKEVSKGSQLNTTEQPIKFNNSVESTGVLLANSEKEKSDTQIPTNQKETLTTSAESTVEPAKIYALKNAGDAPNPVIGRFEGSSPGQKAFSVPTTLGATCMMFTAQRNNVAPTVSIKTSESSGILRTTNSEASPFMFGNNNSAINSQIKTGPKATLEPKSNPVFSFGSSSNNGNLTGGNQGILGNQTIVPELKSVSTLEDLSTPKSVSSVSTVQATGIAKTKSTGFNFGSVPSNNPIVNNSQQQFVFGTSQKPVSSGGFSFCLPEKNSVGNNSTSVNSAFSSGIKPTFNFTGGSVPTFTASPAVNREAVPTRKFKKAVRRTAQR